MCVCVRVHIDTVFALLSHHLPAWPSFVSRVWSCLIHQTTRNEIQQDTRSTQNTFFFLRWWLPKVDVLPWKHLCFSFSRCGSLVLFLAPMSEQAATQLAPELGHEKLKVVIYTIPMMLHCSGMVGSSWISIRNRMRDSWKAGKNRGNTSIHHRSTIAVAHFAILLILLGVAKKSTKVIRNHLLLGFLVRYTQK